jgi:hypothetical protein
LKVVIEKSKFAHRIVELENGDDKRKESSGSERVGPDPVAPHQQQQGDCHGANRIHER